MEEKVVLVNKKDEVLGLMPKQEAHIEGVLHRAFSVFIFNDKGETLLQQRAEGKYHSPLKWTNSCCSHPRENESYLEGARRRVKEELNIDVELEYLFDFIYKADVGGGLTEHEFDYVFVGKYNGVVNNFNSEEVNATKWMKINDVIEDIEKSPDDYTEWFKIIFEKYTEKIEKR